MTNPEQAVIDAIDALVDDQLDGYRDRSGYDHNVNQVRCSLCQREWHGLREGYCPGAFATGPQRIRYRRLRERMWGEWGRPVAFAASGRLSSIWAERNHCDAPRRALRAIRSVCESLASLTHIPNPLLPPFSTELQPPDPAAPWLVFIPPRSHDCMVVPVWDGSIANAAEEARP
ncbi:hypothetical protein [Mycobacteroides franklinii]|uniref:Uncharacterized protein n=1 Tax=Mycobacteroides franklinii TaxID=948102 RepID=A0A4R5PGD3_9MYCO|nr:hypothetical protein [Mycobacteroides franklinii]ORA57248.1 hypothetical protein BST24_23885 [Mycobacteroides franklinii]TDH25349.1 hypothetical protein EJ571_01695 [Mycobacteroides franklinii]